MLVRKKNPGWSPSENRELKVGETIEITDPKQLIINGEAEAVGPSGDTISAFELYGVLVQDEMAEFQDYMKRKKAEDDKARLEKERVALEAQLAEAKKVETPAVVEEVSEVKVESTDAEAKAKTEKVVKASAK